jgi:predicted nucleic acid-binding protein
MSLAVLADTGPLYAANDEEDEHHHRALRDLRKLALEKREVIIPYPTVVECFTLLLFRLGHAAATEWLSEIRSTSLLNPEPGDYAQAFARVRALPGQRITLVDATIAAVAARLRVQVWSYDHHFDVMRSPVWR